MNTALRAGKQVIKFKNTSHQEFYEEMIQRCRYQDEYHKALIYCLGISGDTRRHIQEIYDFETGCVNTECLRQGWNTSSSKKVIRLAFNLYCNNTPSVDDYKKHADQMTECRQYTVEEIFCSSDARYFYQAIKLRYPEYCFCVEMEE